MEFCINSYNNAQKKEAYEVYVTDTLRIISESIAKIAGGSYINKRYYDIINPKPEIDKSAQEIVDDVVKKSGIKVVKSA